MMLAWFSSSLTIASSAPRMVSKRPPFQTPRGGGEHSGIVSEPEVVVGAEVQDFLSPDPDQGALRREDQPLPLLEPGLLDGGQFTADG